MEDTVRNNFEETVHKVSCREMGKQELSLDLHEEAAPQTQHGNPMAHPPSNALLHAGGC